jgi:RNA polymerase sigma factor (sigma-70 family)
MAGKQSPPETKRRKLVAALVLGTALTAFGAPPALAGDGVTATKCVNDISRYCTACWRNARLPADCWGDCTQEVLSRLLQSIDPGSWEAVFVPEGAERQEFLRAIDAVKKRTQRQLKRTTYLNHVVPDRDDKAERTIADDREVVQLAAQEVLSERQQKILRMSFEGWAVQDMADELGIAPERISDEKYKAIRKLRHQLQVD